MWWWLEPERRQWMWRQEVVLEVEFIGLTDELDISVYRKGKMQDNMCACVHVCVSVHLWVPELIAGLFTEALKELLIGWRKWSGGGWGTAGEQGKGQVLQALSSHAEASGLYLGLMGSLWRIWSGEWYNQICMLERCFCCSSANHSLCIVPRPLYWERKCNCDTVLVWAWTIGEFGYWTHEESNHSGGLGFSCTSGWVEGWGWQDVHTPSSCRRQSWIST